MSKKPAGTTLEGMIWNANAILEKAVSPDFNGIPKGIVRNCHGVVILSVVEAGAVFSGTVGSGIIIARDPAAGTWSPPCACGLKGLGFGLLVGGCHTDFITFVLDTATMATFIEDKSVKCAGEATAALGKLGRNLDLELNPTNNGDVTVSFTNGAFAGVSIEGANIRPRGKANDKFYGKPTLSKDILQGVAVKMPEGKVTLMDEVYKKLDLLCEGKTAEPSAAEKTKVVEAKKVADAKGEESKKEEDVVVVDAKVEAAKEAKA